MAGRFWIITILSCQVPNVRSYQRSGETECIPIREPLCRGNYNFTSMPNILGHEDHEEASARLAEFAPLIENSCSDQIKFFLCSLHFPMCDPKIPYGIPACREMCEAVRRKCEPYLAAFHLPWPETIKCGKLPLASSLQCLIPRPTAPRARTSEKPAVIVRDVQRTETISERQERRHRKRQRRLRKDRKGKAETVEPAATDFPVSEVTAESPEPRISHRWSPIELNDQTEHEDSSVVANRDVTYDQFPPSRDKMPDCQNEEKFVYVEKLNKCVPVCGEEIDVLFSSRDKIFAYYWMVACALACFLSSAFTFGTFLVDSKRFKYPERPIIFLSLCYLLYATAYLIRLGRGPKGSVSCVTLDKSDVQHIVMGELESTGCTAVFFLLYYFGMASAAWWVVLSVAWFLAAGLKWSQEAIESHGLCLHLAAWLLPALQTVVVLVLGRVDGDELTGLCYVGNLDKSALLYFVVLPLAAYLAVGSVALSCGFLSLLKIRRVMRKTGQDPVRLEKLIWKIGAFSLLYVVPSACVLAVNLYQFDNFDRWRSRAEARPCYPPHDCHLPESIPSLPVLLIKLLMSLLVGMTSGLWVWSEKTCRSWTGWCRVTSGPSKGRLTLGDIAREYRRRDVTAAATTTTGKGARREWRREYVRT